MVCAGAPACFSSAACMLQVSELAAIYCHCIQVHRGDFVAEELILRTTIATSATCEQASECDAARERYCAIMLGLVVGRCVR